MDPFSRRSFLKGGSAAIVGVGALSALPGLPALVGTLESQAPAAAGEADAAAGSAAAVAESSVPADGPIVAHVRNLATGEIGLFAGTREITVVAPDLAARLARALG